jgi:hypothetical protein
MIIFVFFYFLIKVFRVFNDHAASNWLNFIHKVYFKLARFFQEVQMIKLCSSIQSFTVIKHSTEKVSSCLQNDRFISNYSGHKKHRDFDPEIEDFDLPVLSLDYLFLDLNIFQMNINADENVGRTSRFLIMSSPAKRCIQTAAIMAHR